MATPETTVVHLLRHGEVDNPQGILYGRLPGFQLSALGREMAVAVTAHLAARDLVHVASSPLERAIETAQPIADSHGLGIHVDGRLIEAGNFFEGRVVGASLGALLEPRSLSRLVDPFTPSWGEAYAAIAARMYAAVADVRDAARGHEALVVSHQLPIWTLRCRLEGRRLWHDPRKRQCSLASLTSLHYLGNELTSIVYTEPAAHLQHLASRKAGA
jgi:broad specificity phosphatase PhoE